MARIDPSESAIKYGARLGIMLYLETASSATEQRAFEKRLRNANAPGCVPTEMICQWEDCFRLEDADHFGAPEFSNEEQRAMFRFHSVWNQVADETPDPMPPNINDLIGTQVWQKLIDAAAEALATFEVRGQLRHLAESEEN